MAGQGRTAPIWLQVIGAIIGGILGLIVCPFVFTVAFALIGAVLERGDNVTLNAAIYFGLFVGIIVGLGGGAFLGVVIVRKMATSKRVASARGVDAIGYDRKRWHHIALWSIAKKNRRAGGPGKFVR
jgi:hypothetical protein